MAQGCLVSKAGGAPHQEVQALMGKCRFGRRKDAGEERLIGLIARGGGFGLMGLDVRHYCEDLDQEYAQKANRSVSAKETTSIVIGVPRR